MSRNSFAQAAQLDGSFQRPSKSHMDDMLTNFFDAVQLKPESSSDSVHGRMLRVAQPEPWDLSVACFSIASLQLSKTVDIVHLLKHHEQFQSFSNDDTVLAHAITIFKSANIDLQSESNIMPWILGQTNLLQQQLQTIYDHNLLPLSLKVKLSTAIKIAATLVRDELADRISKSSSDSDDDDWTENSFTISYSNNRELQNLLKLRPSDDYLEDVYSAESAPSTIVLHLDYLSTQKYHVVS